MDEVMGESMGQRLVSVEALEEGGAKVVTKVRDSMGREAVAKGLWWW